MTAPSHHAAPKIGTTPPRECLRCSGGMYTELREGCFHAYTIEALAPSPLIEDVAADGGRERYYLASLNGAPPNVVHPIESEARRLFAERWLWGQAIGALFEWLHERVFRFDLTRPGAMLMVNKPRTLGPSGFYATQDECLAAMDRAIEAAVVGTEGEAADAFAALKARESEAKQEAADLAAGLRAAVAAATGIAGMTLSELRASVGLAPMSGLFAGRFVVRRSPACECGADTAISLPEFGVAGWYVCTGCHATNPDLADPLASVPDALRGFRVRRPACVVRDLVTPCPSCSGTTWLVSDVVSGSARRSIDALCADPACGERCYVIPPSGAIPLVTRPAPAEPFTGPVTIPPHDGPETIDVWPIGTRVALRAPRQTADRSRAQPCSPVASATGCGGTMVR